MTESEFYKMVGGYLCRARITKKLTIHDVSVLTGMSDSHLTALERGDVVLTAYDIYLIYAAFHK